MTPKCPSCTNHTFRLVEFEPQGSRFKMFAICCSSCGAVVGVEPYHNTAELLFSLAEKLRVKI
jgi:hypothetical protein